MVLGPVFGYATIPLLFGGYFLARKAYRKYSA